MFKWFKKMFAPAPRIEPMPQRCRFDDIEDDIKEIRQALQNFSEDVGKAVRELKSRVGELEKKGEWKPRFGDRVRFRHSYFGEMIGVIIDFPFPSQYLLVFRDPSDNDDTKFYTVKAEDVEKCND